MRFFPISLVILMGMAVFLGPSVHAEGESGAFRSWLSSSAGARVQSRGAIGEGTFDALFDRGVPSGYVIRRLEESSAKGVPNARAVQSILSEVETLARLSLAMRDYLRLAERDVAAFLVDAMAAVRNGLPVGAVLAVLGDPRVAKLDFRRVGAALIVETGTRGTLPPSGSDDISVLASDLALSGLDVSRFGSFLSLAARARADGASPSDFYAKVGSLLRGGAGFSEIERGVRGGGSGW